MFLVFEPMQLLCIPRHLSNPAAQMPPIEAQHSLAALRYIIHMRPTLSWCNKKPTWKMRTGKTQRMQTQEFLQQVCRSTISLMLKCKKIFNVWNISHSGPSVELLKFKFRSIIWSLMCYSICIMCSPRIALSGRNVFYLI